MDVARKSVSDQASSVKRRGLCEQATTSRQNPRVRLCSEVGSAYGRRLSAGLDVDYIAHKVKGYTQYGTPPSSLVGFCAWLFSSVERWTVLRFYLLRDTAPILYSLHIRTLRDDSSHQHLCTLCHPKHVSHDKLIFSTLRLTRRHRWSEDTCRSSLSLRRAHPNKGLHARKRALCRLATAWWSCSHNR